MSQQRMSYSGIDMQRLLLVLQWAFGKLFNVNPKDWEEKDVY